MPWKIMNTMDQKIRLIAGWRKQIFNIIDLSQKYEISRSTVYKLTG
ncbi:MAG: hypothetical protein DDT42_01573 [candidate division WS2 bacterium]|uniref:Uncharacterized protein n=1 Tax=Psychracetigena formicireducens TaxID=2986056 RepID=A0A9E2BHK8_PSYF1|nr:hypothetical protein [Candidatus Psychracetigena formicireducens]